MPDVEKPKLLVFVCEECNEEVEEERFHHQRHAPATCSGCGGVAYYDETQDEVEVGSGS